MTEDEVVAALNGGRRMDAVRQLVCMALEQKCFDTKPFPYRSPELVRALIACLKDPDASIRDAAARILGLIRDPSALEPLLQVIERTQALADKVAADGIGEPTGEQMMALFPRKSALGALAELGLPKAIAVVRKLAPKEPDAAIALSFVRDVKAIEWLMALLDSKDKHVRMAAAIGLWQRASLNGPGVAEVMHDLHATARADRTAVREFLRQAAFLSVSSSSRNHSEAYRRLTEATRETAGSFLIDQPRYESPLFADGKLGDVLAKAAKCPGLRTPIVVDWAGLAETGISPGSKVRVDWAKLAKQSQSPDRPGGMRVTVVDVLWETLNSVSTEEKPVGAALLGEILVVSTLDRLVRYGPQIAEAPANAKAKGRISIHLTGVPISGVFQFLQAASGLAVVPDWPVLEKAGIRKGMEISIPVRDMRVIDAAWTVVIQVGGFTKVGCEVRDGKLIIGVAKAKPKPAVAAPSPTPEKTTPPTTTPPARPEPRAKPVTTPPPDVPQEPAPDEQSARRKLQLARTYAANKLTDKAKAILESIIKNYPDTEAAKQARQDLKTLK